MLSWLGAISSWLGGSEAWIKFWPSLLGAATLVITCLISAEFGGGKFAQFLAGLGIITGAFMRIHSLYQPNVLEIFFWTLTAWFLVKYINTKNTGFITGIVISLALGWYGKYSVLFFATGVIISLLLSKHRKIFLQKQVWIAGALAIIFILPNVFWQYQHNWPLIHHMEELKETQLQYLNPSDFIKDQLLYLLPVCFVWIAGLIWSLGSSNYRVFGIIYFVVIVLLLTASGKSYYAMGLYPMLLAAGATFLEKWSINKNWFRYAIVILIMVLSIPFIPMLLPVWKPAKLADFYKTTGIEKTGLLKWEDGQDHPLPQDFADMLGWKELAGKTEKFYLSLPPDIRNQTVIYARNYGQAGSIIYYGKNKELKKKVFSTNGSFILWADTTIHFDNLILIGEKVPGAGDEVFDRFREYRIIDSVTHPYSRFKGDKIIFFNDIDEIGLQLARESLKKERDKFVITN